MQLMGKAVQPSMGCVHMDRHWHAHRGQVGKDRIGCRGSVIQKYLDLGKLYVEGTSSTARAVVGKAAWSHQTQGLGTDMICKGVGTNAASSLKPGAGVRLCGLTVGSIPSIS